jgi:hypothetical protein
MYKVEIKVLEDVTRLLDKISKLDANKKLNGFDKIQKEADSLSLKIKNNYTQIK